MTLSNINSFNIISAIEMGCETMSNVFNPDDNDIPYFFSEVLPNPRLGFSERHSESHVPGRHLNALLTAEEVANIQIKDSVIKKHQNAAFFSYSGVLPFPLNRQKIGGDLINFNEHNFREGFHALYALVKYRNSNHAMEILKQSISTIFDLWDSHNGWNYTELYEINALKPTDGEHTFITGLGRSIGALVKIYDCTRYEPAIKLASMLVEKSLSEFFLSEGLYDSKIFGTHTHSTTCVMSGLAQYGEFYNDTSILKTVKNFYDNGLWDIRDYIGWVIESSAEDSEPDRGECNNTGDIVETALILGNNGYENYYEDAERILRCHLLPSQLRDNSFIPETNHSGKDEYHKISERHLGAFGFPAPYGHWPVDQYLDQNLSRKSKVSSDRIGFNMDIVGGTIASLCEVIKHVVIEEDAFYKVNLFFNVPIKTDGLEINCNDEGNIIFLKIFNPKDVFIRIPSWALSQSIEINDNINYEIINGYMKISNTRPSQKIQITFNSKRRKVILNHRTRDIGVFLDYDNVVSMENFGADLTFFPEI